MEVTQRLGSVAAGLILLVVGSNHAAAMMGFEGPPPCESQSCFIEAVSKCEADASYVTPMEAGASAQYLVEGADDDGSCKLGMIYMTYPQSEWTYKPLHFVIDPNAGIEAQLKEAVAACLAGRTDHDYQCSGPLLDISGADGG